MLAIAILAVLVVGGFFYLQSHLTKGKTVVSGYTEQGRLIYIENCQACHGNKLQGQSNWQSRKADGRLPAPPHDETGHTWHHPDQVLFTLTKYGPSVMAGQGYESDMPAYDGVLSDAEIEQVLDYIKSTWPEDIRLEQARRTKRMENAS